jgi:hypothetical protein
VDRRGGAGEVPDLVHLDVQGKGDVVAQQLEVAVRQCIAQVLLGAGVEVVHAQHLAPRGEQRLAQVRAEESGAAGDQRALTRRIFHVSIP